MISFIFTVFLYACVAILAVYCFIWVLIGLAWLVLALPMILILGWILFFFGLPFYLAFNAGWFWIFSAVFFWYLSGLGFRLFEKYESFSDF